MQFLCLAALAEASLVAGKMLLNTAPHGETAEVGHDDLTTYFHSKNGSTPPKEIAALHVDGATSVSIGLFSSALLLPFVFTLTQKKGLVGSLTWKFVDNYIATFVALLYYNAFNDFIQIPYINNFVSSYVVAAIQVALLYMIALTVASKFKNSKYRLLTFSACAAEYISFAGVTFVDHTARRHFAGTPWMPFLGAFVAFAFFAILFASVYQYRRHIVSKGNSYNHAIDDMELDVAGVCVSFVVTQAVRTVAGGGKYPEALFLLGINSSSGFTGHSEEHSTMQRLVMLVYSLIMILLCRYSLVYLSEFGKHGYWHRKFAHFLQVTFTMCAAWGFLLWGKWQFHESSFSHDVMFSHMLFAFLCTIFSLTTVYVVGTVIDENYVEARMSAEIGCAGLALVCAWSWEHCIDMAIDTVAANFEMGYGGLIPKLILAVTIPCVLMPVYVYHVKPQVLGDEIHDDVERAPALSDADSSNHPTPQAKGFTVSSFHSPRKSDLRSMKTTNF